MSSLVHDARNPLNALAIHVEVLTERLRNAGGAVPASAEKSLRAMREQIRRVDQVLREFSDFMAPLPSSGPVDLAALLQRAIVIAGHESRRRRVSLDVAVVPGVFVQVSGGEAAALAAIAPLLWSMGNTPPGEVLHVRLARAQETARYELSSERGWYAGPKGGAGSSWFPDVREMVSLEKGSIHLDGTRLEVELPLAPRTPVSH